MEGFLDHYEVEDCVHVARTTEIYKCRRRSPTRRARIVKVVCEGRMQPSERVRLKREPRLMHQLFGDDRFVQMYRSVFSGGRLFIVMEFCEHGDIINFHMNHQDISLTLEWQREAMRRMAQIVEALHSLKIAHRDLKPDNFFVRKDGTICLGDFGLATRIGPVSHRSPIGTHAYAAPELGFRCRGYIDPAACDIYSLGVTFFVLAAGREPFPANLQRREIMDYKVTHDLPVIADRPALDDLLWRMTLRTPSDRPNATQVLQHQFFQ